MTKYVYINGYRIKYNSYWDKGQTEHDEIGTCEEFETLDEAKEYCNKG